MLEQRLVPARLAGLPVGPEGLVAPHVLRLGPFGELPTAQFERRDDGRLLLPPDALLLVARGVGWSSVYATDITVKILLEKFVRAVVFRLGVDVGHAGYEAGLVIKFEGQGSYTVSTGRYYI